MREFPWCEDRFLGLWFGLEWLLAGVMVGVHVEERFGVWLLWWARCALGFRGFGVWGLPNLHGPLRHQDRSTTVRLLRVMLGLVGPCEAVVRVDPGCAVPGSVGGPHLRGMVNVGVGERGRRFLRAQLTLGVLSVSWDGAPWVLTSGGDRRTGCL